MTVSAGPVPDVVELGSTGLTTPALYTIAEAARLLNVPVGWLSKKVSAHEVPHTRLGKHVRFTPEHIQLIIAAGEQQPRAVPLSSGVSRRARRAG
jgi:excisionase family DNA binding protein